MNKERPDLIHNVTALPDKPHAPWLKQDLTIMAALPNCPACLAQDAGIYLAHVTEDAADSYFRYYRCPCGHMWGVHKDQPRVICHITPLSPKQKASLEQLLVLDC